MRQLAEPQQEITFTAYGVPAPKGSMRAVLPKGARRPVMINDNPHTRPWAALVQCAALQAIGNNHIPFQSGVPVALSVTFYMPRPKTLPKKTLCPVKKPDLDKLLRNLKDALTGIVWNDDSQVVKIEASKHYALEMPRAEVTVTSI